MSSETENLDLHPVASGGKLDKSVPVIDLAPLTLSPDNAGRRELVDQIGRACREWGFFQVMNHGIHQDLVLGVVGEMQRFFNQPRPVKERILRDRNNPWGYYNNELTKNQRDKKEVFDFTRDGVDPIYKACNRWPDDGGAFRDTMLKWFAACEKLSLQLLEAFCEGLGLPPRFLHGDFEGKHTGFVRLNYYPVSDPLAGSDIDHLQLADLGVHHHTDAGAFTILLQDDVGGLQVHHEGLWYDIEPVADAFVINTGDMMQVWSNDTYRAAVHRVLAMNHRDRFSIPFFFNPAAHSRVRPLPSMIDERSPARYRPIDWSEFRGRRTDGDYADYGAEIQIAQFRTGSSIGGGTVDHP